MHGSEVAKRRPWPFATTVGVFSENRIPSSARLGIGNLMVAGLPDMEALCGNRRQAAENVVDFDEGFGTRMSNDDEAVSLVKK